MAVICLIKNNNWYDEMWNPMTGSISTWSNSYAKEYCNRFKGDVRLNMSSKLIEKVDDEHFILNEPFPSSADKHYIDCPLGTLPTFHTYRLNKPAEKFKTGRNIYVCGMGELFSDDIPMEWLHTIIHHCGKNSQHNYIFITSDIKGMYKAISNQYFHQINMWFGTVIRDNLTNDSVEFVRFLNDKMIHSFIKIESINKAAVDIISKFVNCGIEWIIATPDKNATDKDIDELIELAKINNIPIFIEDKSSKYPRQLPLALQKHTISVGNKKRWYAKCGNCKGEFQKKEMHTIGSYVKRGEGYKVMGYLCEECFNKLKKQFE